MEDTHPRETADYTASPVRRKDNPPRGVFFQWRYAATQGDTTIFFIRHGESVHHVTGMTGGWTDTPLTDAGARQIKGTAGALQRLASAGPSDPEPLHQRALAGQSVAGRDLARADQVDQPVKDFVGDLPSRDLFRQERSFRLRADLM